MMKRCRRSQKPWEDYLSEDKADSGRTITVFKNWKTKFILFGLRGVAAGVTGRSPQGAN